MLRRRGGVAGRQLGQRHLGRRHHAQPHAAEQAEGDAGRRLRAHAQRQAAQHQRVPPAGGALVGALGHGRDPLVGRQRRGDDVGGRLGLGCLHRLERALDQVQHARRRLQLVAAAPDRRRRQQVRHQQRDVAGIRQAREERHGIVEESGCC
jgi:hypothetical protein